MILCLETSAAMSSVALGDGQQCWSRQAATENFQAEHLLSLIDAVLCEAKLKNSDIAVLAVSSGPGRFTGLRVGVAVAQGLAFAWNKQVIAIDSLAVLATGIHRRHGAESVMVMMDARREEIYRQSFIWDGEVMLSQQDLSIIKANLVLPQAPLWVGAGSGFVAHPPLAKALNKCYISAADQLLFAQDMIPLAVKAYKDKKAVDPGQVLPNYLREEVVTSIM